MPDPQDQIEVLVLCVKFTRQISVDLTAFYTSSDAGNAEWQYVVLVVHSAIVTAARRSAVSPLACLA
jgi:hypothetical protein